MGWLTWEERDQIWKQDKIRAEYNCDFCLKPISSTELPVIDPKGGYHKKEAGQPDFLSPHPKKSYHYRCDQIRRGKRPKDEPKSPPKESKQSPEPKQQKEVKNNGHASKKLVRIGEVVLETVRKRPKHLWNVWEVVLALRDRYKQAEIRGACNYLKTEGLLKRKNRVLRPTTKHP